jgi:hypothetical protein
MISLFLDEKRGSTNNRCLWSRGLAELDASEMS